MLIKCGHLILRTRIFWNVDGDVWRCLPLWQQNRANILHSTPKEYSRLRSTQQVTWQQNWDTCCSLGMTPITLDSVTEQDCLSRLTVSTNWTGNNNYWTGGTQKDCRGSWSWCGNTVSTDIADALKWEIGQPDNLGGRQDCIHLKNVNGTGLRLTDRNCTDRYILACKVFDYFKIFVLK